MDGNRETILDELNDFEKRSNEISPVLEDYLLKIAKMGDTMFPWAKLKPLLKRKVEIVLDEFYETCPTDGLPALPNVENFKFEILKSKILEAIDTFQSAPFTIQRICELLTSPRKHYKRTDKFMRGLEKNILVVSTVEPASLFINEVNNNSAGALVNGMISAESELTAAKEVSTVNFSSSSKSNSCPPQFDNFNLLSSSTSVIADEMPQASQQSKNECPGSTTDVNSNNANMNEVSETVSDMDIAPYRDPQVHGSEEDHCYSEHRNNFEEKQTSDLRPSLNNNNTSLENFSIFAPSSSVAVMDASNLTQTDACNLTESERKFSSNNEHEMDLGTFQGACDSQLVGNTAYMASASGEQESYPRDKQVDISHASHGTDSTNREFFSDLCCELKEVEPISGTYANGPESFVAPVVHDGKETSSDKNQGNMVMVNNPDESSESCIGKDLLDAFTNEHSNIILQSMQPPDNRGGQLQSTEGLECQSQPRIAVDCLTQPPGDMRCQTQTTDSLECQPQSSNGLVHHSQSSEELGCELQSSSDVPFEPQSPCNLPSQPQSSKASESHSQSSDELAHNPQPTDDDSICQPKSDGVVLEPCAISNAPLQLHSVNDFKTHAQSPDHVTSYLNSPDHVITYSQSPEHVNSHLQSSDHLNSQSKSETLNTLPHSPNDLTRNSESPGCLSNDSISPGGRASHPMSSDPEECHQEPEHMRSNLESLDSFSVQPDSTKICQPISNLIGQLQSSDSLGSQQQSSGNLGESPMSPNHKDVVQSIDMSALQTTSESACNHSSTKTIVAQGSVQPLDNITAMVTVEGSSDSSLRVEGSNFSASETVASPADEICEQEMMDVEYPQKSENHSDLAEEVSNALNESEAMEEG